MRKFIVIFSLASAVFFVQWRNSNEAAGGATHVIVAQPTSPVPPRPVYEHDWAKNSLDRAQLAVSAVQTARQETEQR